MLTDGLSHTSGSCRDGYLVVEPGWDGALLLCSRSARVLLARSSSLRAALVWLTFCSGVARVLLTCTSRFGAGGKTVADEAAAATLTKTSVECEWFDFVDPAVSLLLSIGIGLSVVPLLKRALPILLDAAPPGVSLPRIRSQLRQIPRVVGVGALHVWMVDDGNVAACIAHLFVDLPPPPIDAASLDFGSVHKQNPFACDFEAFLRDHFVVAGRRQAAARLLAVAQGRRRECLQVSSHAICPSACDL